LTQLQLSDPTREYQALGGEAVLSVLDDNVRRLEKPFAEFCGVGHSIGTASGTTALVVGLHTAGISSGDEAYDALGITRLQPPAHTNPSWCTYVIRLSHRHQVIRSLQQHGTHFTPMVHTRLLYKHLGYQEGCFPVADKVTHDLICLPFHPHLSDEEVNRVIDALADITQQKDMVS